MVKITVSLVPDNLSIRSSTRLLVVLLSLWLSGCATLTAPAPGPTASTTPTTAPASLTALARAAETAPVPTPTSSPTPLPVPTASPTTSPTPSATPESVVRLVAVGDMLPHDSVNLRAYDPATEDYDYTKFMTDVAPLFAQADIRLCNQEAASSPALPVEGYPRFNAPPAFARDLHRQGCNLITLANNHLADHDQAGIDGTLAVWDSLPSLAVAGANRSPEEQNQPHFFTIEGIRFAFVALTETSNRPPPAPYALNMLEAPLLQQQLAAARAEADVVIVAVHWGYENAPQPSESQRTWAQRLADAGADLIIGSGPHVLQPVEWLPTARGETLVWYSLGNLLSTQLKLEELIGGIGQMDIRLVEGRPRIDALAFYPTYMHYDWPPDGDLLGRDNLHLYPLLEGAEALNRAHGRTAEEMWAEVEDRLNQSAEVQLLSP